MPELRPLIRHPQLPETATPVETSEPELMPPPATAQRKDKHGRFVAKPGNPTELTDTRKRAIEGARRIPYGSPTLCICLRANSGKNEPTMLNHTSVSLSRNSISARCKASCPPSCHRRFNLANSFQSE